MFDINSDKALQARAILLAKLGATREIRVKKVIYNYPATIVYWTDGTRTVVKCQPGDVYDRKLGFLLAVCKKSCGNTGAYNKLLKEYVPDCGEEEKEPGITTDEMRKRLYYFCYDRSCIGCSLHDLKCGFGFHFMASSGEKGYMTDDEVREAYKIVFKEDSHNG